MGCSTEKNTQQFQALNGLKCSTVGNFIRYNVIRVYPLFWSTKLKTINFFELIRVEKIIGTVKCVATCGAIEIQVVET